MALPKQDIKAAPLGREPLQPGSRARRLPGQWGKMTAQGRLPTAKKTMAGYVSGAGFHRSCTFSEATASPKVRDA